ncbi:hypothetical protein EVJ33_10855 [Exiguobacterium sp. SL-10]|nr:hypothetical protein EVJ33_10855 [Exiguobacterium sp. SL-10]
MFESLESGKLGEEIFSVSYVDYFNRLPYMEREHLGKAFERFRNGVNPETLRAIYGSLYHRTADGSDQATNLYTQIEIERVSHSSNYLVEGTHQHTGESFMNEYDPSWRRPDIIRASRHGSTGLRSSGRRKISGASTIAIKSRRRPHWPVVCSPTRT